MVPTTAATPSPWLVLVVAAALSIITMPVTAAWLTLIGPLVAVVAAGLAAIRPGEEHRARTVSIGGALAAGLLVGPVLYLGLALTLAG